MRVRTRVGERLVLPPSVPADRMLILRGDFVSDFRGSTSSSLADHRSLRTGTAPCSHWCVLLVLFQRERMPKAFLVIAAKNMAHHLRQVHCW
jgi:hypothetical protein